MVGESAMVSSLFLMRSLTMVNVTIGHGSLGSTQMVLAGSSGRYQRTRCLAGV